MCARAAQRRRRRPRCQAQRPRTRDPARSVDWGVGESLRTTAQPVNRVRRGRDSESERMTSHSQRMSANGDAIAHPLEAPTGRSLRPTSTDRTVAMAAELHTLPALLTVAETADVLRVGRSWVYEHATELGAIKLGRGRTAPLRIPRDGLHRILGAPLLQEERRSLPTRRARNAERPHGDLRPRPRL
jgi:hypothetical protein